MQQRLRGASARLSQRLLRLDRWQKRSVAIAFDVLLCAFSVWFAYYLRLGYWPAVTAGPAWPILVSVSLAVPVFAVVGLYRAIFRYAELAAIHSIGWAVSIYGALFCWLYTFIGVAGVPRTVGLIQPLLLLVMLCASRVGVRVWLNGATADRNRRDNKPRVMIYGAGSAGRQLASAIIASRGMKLIGFLDDDQRLWGATLNGVRIWNPAKLDTIANRWGLTDVLLAVPSATKGRRNAIVAALRHLQLHIQTLPAVLDLARGSVSIADLKELEIEDLLGREPVAPDLTLLQRNITGKVVLVTGAGGSIGSELCRQIILADPALLLLVDLSEHSLYLIHQELIRFSGSNSSVVPVALPLLASVQDERRMREIIGTWRPDTIYHAAAYKHVPLVEHNTVEGVRNNVLGTLVTASLAIEYAVANFVLISTDKAVRPTNIMGTSKRLAEMVLQALHAEGCDTCLSIVRFGNVLGSSGSVVPLFRQQIATGGPITITDREITRYFMTIPEAAQLVIQAGAMGGGGDVFVLDMGEPVRIYDLARNMIELSGLSLRDDANLDGDIAIRVVGLRPGEKLFEELLIGGDVTATSHARIMRARERMLPWGELSLMLQSISTALEQGDAARVRALLRAAVPEYSQTSELVDWVARQRSAAMSDARSDRRPGG
ncbi:polysaccharide biosynthesis protein [Sphingomonas sp.]|uniref:polysaccharide biosynthesis protein n=1 Tax=Sphingomonas sp. TaxID=28214 RepID=UPI003CC677F2